MILGAAPADAVDAAEEPAVTGYALGSLPPKVLDRDAHALTTVSVAAAPITPDGRRVRPPSDSVVRVGRLARARGLHTELLLSNYSNRLEAFDEDAVHALLSDPRSIRRVARLMATRVAAGGWDGVNVDFERVRRSDAAGLASLVEQLQTAMPADRTVTIDVSAATSVAAYRSRGYLMGRLGRAADAVQLMAYDQHGPSWSEPGPIGGLGWQRRAVEAALERVPAARLDLGVAGYGYTWRPDGTGRSFAPRWARRATERAGVKPVWHRRAGEWSARLPDGRRLWWSDARSWALRVDLARAYDLRGLALWRLGTADPLP